MRFSIAQACTERAPNVSGAASFLQISPKIALVTCPCGFRLRGLAQNGCRGVLGAPHFFCKFLRDMALVCISTAQAYTKGAGHVWGDIFL